MKKCLLLWLVCITGFTNAQQTQPLSIPQKYAQAYKPKTWLIGGQAGYSQGLIFDHNLTTQVYGGYFVTTKLLVGFGASASREGFKSVRDIAYSVGPVVRYQLTQTRFSPFLIASCQIGQRTVSGSESRITRQTVITSSGPIIVENGSILQGSGIAERLYSRSLGAGLSIGLTPLLKVDLVLTWQDKVSTINSGIHFANGLYQPQLGVNYLMGTKK